MEQELVYSKERGTWNLFVNGEWYCEGTYEECNDTMLNNAIYYNRCDEEEPNGYDEY